MSTTHSEPTGDQFADDMAKVIKTLMRHHGITALAAYERLHISKGTWFNHMRHGTWSARQISELATMLDVPVETLYQDPDELLRTGSIATLDVIDGDATNTSADRPLLTLVR